MIGVEVHPRAFRVFVCVPSELIDDGSTAKGMRYSYVRNGKSVEAGREKRVDADLGVDVQVRCENRFT